MLNKGKSTKCGRSLKQIVVGIILRLPLPFILRVGSLTGKAFGLQPRGRGFDSYPIHQESVRPMEGQSPDER